MNSFLNLRKKLPIQDAILFKNEKKVGTKKERGEKTLCFKKKNSSINPNRDNLLQNLNPVRTCLSVLNKKVTVGRRHVFAVALAIIGNYMQSQSSDPKLIYNWKKLIN